MAGFGGLTVTNLSTPSYEERHVYSNWAFGTPASEFKYRFGWMSAVATSPWEEDALYFGGNQLWKSTDKGRSWKAISPDLTTNDQEKLKLPGGKLAVETSGAEIACIIVRMAVSKHNKGTIWVGTDDGQVQLTKNEGSSWANVTPQALPENSKILEVIESNHNPAHAYIVATRIKGADDRSPYIYKTEDYGASWMSINGNFPDTEITRTICEDAVVSRTALGRYGDRHIQLER